MKKIKSIICAIATATAAVSFAGCNDFLDITPPSTLSPVDYLTDESHLEAYTMNRYNALSPFVIGADNQTDNQATNQAWTGYTPEFHLLPLDGGNWSTDAMREIYHINFFFDKVLPAWKAGTISGTKTRIDHYIGEMYFFRAYQYFSKLQAFGDFPIIRRALPNQKDELIEASRRRPQNEVARFIISDLDSAIMLLSPARFDASGNRIYGKTAQLLKSRVALYEATWLKYFNGTAFVPGSAQWPGRESSPDFQFPTGSIEKEIDWFLDRALEAAEDVADNIQLTPNTKILPQAVGESNPYLEMFGAEDMSGYSEILLWQDNNQALNVVHNVTGYAATGNFSIGLTRSLMDAYLMEDGLPTYAASSAKPYMGDGITSLLIQNRDPRMLLFVKQPGQLNAFSGTRGPNTKGWIVEGENGDGYRYPDIFNAAAEDKYSTGYACRKGWNPDIKFWENLRSSTGRIVFRASEAYLNYIEAYYERYGTIAGKADTYWRAIRTRAGIEPDYQVSINATVMSKETLDLGSYSRGVQLTDATLYNIRRERRLELMAEGYRMMDLRRWRSFDQLMATPYRVEGMKIFSSEIWDEGWFRFGADDALWPPTWARQSVSDSNESPYLMPHFLLDSGNPVMAQGGLKWKMAHYWDPIPISVFKNTSNQTQGFTDSPVYQNPGWGMTAGEPALN